MRSAHVLRLHLVSAVYDRRRTIDEWIQWVGLLTFWPASFAFFNPLMPGAAGRWVFRCAF
jgi:hypothetical protein